MVVYIGGEIFGNGGFVPKLLPPVVWQRARCVVAVEWEESREVHPAGAKLHVRVCVERSILYLRFLSIVRICRVCCGSREWLVSLCVIAVP